MIARPYGVFGPKNLRMRIVRDHQIAFVHLVERAQIAYRLSESAAGGEMVEVADVLADDGLSAHRRA